MPKIGLWIALDNPSISVAEACILLEGYGIQYKVLERVGRLLILDIKNINILNRLIEAVYRSANIKGAIIILKEYTHIDKDIISADVRDAIHQYVDIRNEKLAISIMPYKSTLLDDPPALFIRGIAEMALRGMPVKIDLDNPDKRIVVALPVDRVYIGLEVVPLHRKGFYSRLPSKRPAQSPHALHPKLARAMVNLTGAMPGEMLLDPFCGIGSILMEASLLGINSIGIDIMYKWIEGASINLHWIEDKISDLVCGDTVKGFIRGVKYIATDPPYGRTTTLAGYGDTKLLINKFIEISSAIDSIKRVVFMAPKELPIDLETHGFTEIYKFEIPVHKNLIRVLRVADYG